jgi:hypothetical protein
MTIFESDFSDGHSDVGASLATLIMTQYSLFDDSERDEHFGRAA